eukprot:290266_1
MKYWYSDKMSSCNNNNNNNNSTLNINSTNQCKYSEYLLFPSQQIFNSITIYNERIQFQFDIKINHYCNASNCNIVFIGNQYNSFLLSINGINNHFQLKIMNTDLDFFYKIPNAKTLLSDNMYHHINVSITPTVKTIIINGAPFNFYHSQHPYFNELTQSFSLTNYVVSTSEKSSDYINATISNICILSSIDTVHCDDMINGKLLSSSDIKYYRFHVTSYQSILFDACLSLYDTHLYLFDSNFVLLHENDDSSQCGNYQSQLEIRWLSAGEYVLGISGYGTQIHHSFGEYNINVKCTDVNEHNSSNPIKCGETVHGASVGYVSLTFNLTYDSYVTITACDSEIDVQLHLLSLTDPNATKYKTLYEYEHVEYNLPWRCAKQSKIIAPLLPKGLYEITDESHLIGQWEISITCSGSQNYIWFPNENFLSNESQPKSWVQSEDYCRGMLGTTLATVTTTSDINEISTTLFGYGWGNSRSMYIGMYKKAINGSKWNWSDGFSCKYTGHDDCIYDENWKLHHPLSSISDYVDGTCLQLSNDGQDNNIVEVPVTVLPSNDHCDYILCNAPNGKYSLGNCHTELRCWNQITVHNGSLLLIPHEETNHILLTIFWNSTIYVVGKTFVHFTKQLFNVLDLENQWSHVQYNDGYLPVFDQSYYTNYKESLYFQAWNGTYHILVNINLDAWSVEQIIIPLEISQTSEWIANKFMSGGFSIENIHFCIVAWKHQVYVIVIGQILIYQLRTRNWTSISYESDMISSCSESSDNRFIYIFGAWFGSLNKFDTTTNTYVAVTVPNLCRTFSVAVTARNNKIYLPGCSLNVWETLVFDIKSEQFELS